MLSLFVLAVPVLALALAYHRASALAWTAVIGAYLVALAYFLPLSATTIWVLLGALVVLSPIANVPAIRRALISDHLLAWYRRILPQMSDTEREALEAGTVWWDAELFSGAPDWNKLLAYPDPRLSDEEQAFLDGPVEELCRLSNDWETTQIYQDLSPQAWQYAKDQGFLGMIIPKRYGGLEFSAYAHSQVITKLATRCSAATVSVMVPNSLGPAELLLHYGTEAQKDYYLPRLARGQEIPCFALTNPNAGSDAAAIPDFGIVCRGEFQGKSDVLGIRVTWEKRYITLGPVATLLGLAFRLYDPDHLLSAEEDVGITCALIPTNHPGVNIGRRHFPLNAVFQNGPNWGTDVFIPIDWIIGGAAQAGQGWRMLMECLAAGRSISLPSSSVGLAKLSCWAVGAYARVRSQFKTPIGKFEGVEEALARMGGNTYLMDAARRMTAGAVDLGEKPSVVSAIAKYHLTERGRAVINDAMDVEGGKGVCLGPNNHLGRAYQQIPIGITVEGANILTRCLIIFGQGAIRCHPYVLAEMAAAGEADPAKASNDFDVALWGHFRFTLCNAARCLVLGLTSARFTSAPADGEPGRMLQHLTRLSAAFAFLADLSMLSMGGDLKRKEKISGRLGDVLAMLYLASTGVKRFISDGAPAADLPLLRWGVQDALARAQAALAGVLANYPSRPLAWLARVLIFPLGQHFAPPSDRCGQEVARLLITPGEARDRLSAGMYLPVERDEPIATLNAAFLESIAVEPIEAKIRAALRDGRVTPRLREEPADAACAAGIIDASELARLKALDRLRAEVIRVDHFPPDFGVAIRHEPALQRHAA